MIRLVRVELLKLRTTRLWVVLLGIAVLIPALIVVAVLATPGRDPQSHALHELSTVADVRQLLAVGGLAATLALVLGATMSTTEYRYGTAGVTYLATPRRQRVVTSKMVAAAPVGVVYGWIGGCVPLLVALLWFAIRSRTVPLDGSITTQILQMGLQALFAAVMGVAVGAILRNQVAAIVGLLVWVTAVEPIVSALIPVTAKWFPFSGAAGAFSDQTSRHLFGRPTAAVLMAVYVILAWAVAVWLERRRDV